MGDWTTTPPADGTLCVVEVDVDGSLWAGRWDYARHTGLLCCDGTVVARRDIRRYLPIPAPAEPCGECGGTEYVDVSTKSLRGFRERCPDCTPSAESAPVCGVCGEPATHGKLAVHLCDACPPESESDQHESEAADTGQRAGEECAGIKATRLTDTEAEKNRRVYYQGIVYAVCNLLDGYSGSGRIVCGTVGNPTTEVEDTLRNVLAKFKALRFRCHNAGQSELVNPRDNPDVDTDPRTAPASQPSDTGSTCGECAEWPEDTTITDGLLCAGMREVTLAAIKAKTPSAVKDTDPACEHYRPRTEADDVEGACVACGSVGKGDCDCGGKRYPLAGISIATRADLADLEEDIQAHHEWRKKSDRDLAALAERVELLTASTAHDVGKVWDRIDALAERVERLESWINEAEACARTEEE